jgi:tetratricopeptide (TPR) repeat protein
LALALNDRGGAYYGKRDHDRAIRDFDQAIGLDPNNARARW